MGVMLMPICTFPQIRRSSFHFVLRFPKTRGARVAAPIQRHSAGCNLLDEVEKLLALLEEPYVSFETASVRSAETQQLEDALLSAAVPKGGGVFGVSHF